jgi:protein SCO1/2
MIKKIITAVLFFFILSANTFAQVVQSPQVGIVEHLGSKVPMDLKFINDKFETVTLRQIINKPTILSFVYFDCPGLCSPLLEGLGDVIQKTDMKLGKDYQVITISFNYRDTPEKAKAKKKRFTERYAKGNSDGWIFLTTDSATIFNITHSTGFITKAVGLDFVHPSAIIAVSPTGMITRYLYGITFQPIDFKMALIEANKEQPRPTIQKVLLLCYSYDPQGQRYTLDVLKIAGILIIFFILVFVVVYLIKPKKKKQLPD